MTLTFTPGQTQLHASIALIDDVRPEDTESFVVGLKNPHGGAEIGLKREVQVNILSNDDGHGVLEFSDVSTQFPFSLTDNLCFLVIS